jgi:DNA polymerase III subunit gamma/tau
VDTHNLNLARKWRSKNFDQIVGQDLSVRMLKNSLYLNHYFPVYLFAGQKGCGKTSTARVFSAAINCEQLPQFQKDPKNCAVPCLACNSCLAMMAGRHPDFIEIDAASNTGVDNVRQIIDSSALLPLMGRKKIYLIDEAHMLSKAAFNAFLKLMEEPPASVLFILATTDTQKIIDTVRSRCFQLYFKPVDESPLLAHLLKVCEAEQIDADEHALSLIIKETSGSIRDALNLLEQVRFSDTRVTKETVHRVLGHLDDARLLQLFEIVLHKSPAQFLAFAQQESLDSFSAEFLWQRITDLVRASIWIKNGVTPRQFGDYTAQLQFLTRGKSLKYMTALLELFYSHEPLFRKTTAQYAFFEVLLLRICQKNESNSNSNMPAAAMQSSPSEEVELTALDEEDEQQDETEEPEPSYDDENAALWAQLVAQIQILHDPLLNSIFKQGTLLAYDKEKKLITVDFPKQLTFFSDLIETTMPQWQPLFEQILSHKVQLIAQFTQVKAVTESVVAASPKIVKPVLVAAPVAKPVEKPKTQYQPYGQRSMRSAPAPLNEPKIDVSNSAQWPQVNAILLHFPGTVTQIRELV